MDYRDYVAQLRDNAAGFEVGEYGSVRENGRAYPLLRLTAPGKRELVVTSGFHGEEPAGPLTLMRHLPKVLDWARSYGLGLRIYPCINPSGFEAGTRYNASGERPNNDFLRYRLKDGSVVGELHAHHLANDSFLEHLVHHDGPQETKAIVRELEAQPAPHAALDIHQDHYVSEPLTYAYVFGPREPYRALMERAGEFAKVAKSAVVDDATRTGGQITRTDPDGLIEFHDGSVTDYYWRRGVRFVAALETSTPTPVARCEAINLLWIRGFIELAALGHLA